MFVKLFKTDLCQQIRTVPWFYACALAFALLYLLISQLQENVLLSILSGLFLAASLGAAGLGIFYGMLRCWLMLHRQMFLNAAHLYRTLPVTRQQLFGACLCSGLLVLALSLGILVLCMVVVSWNPTGQFFSVSLLLDDFQEEFGTSALWMMGLAVYAQTSFILCCGLFGIIMGKGKIAASILWGLGFYYAVALIAIAALLLFGAFSDGSQFQDSLPPSVFNGILWMTCGMYFSLDGILALFCQKRAAKGLDVL